MIFDNDYEFSGSHGEKVSALTNQFDSNNNKLFLRNIDVYLLAPIVGFLFQQKSNRDRDGENKGAKIAYKQISNNLKALEFQYRLIMLLDKVNEPVLEKRVDKAFRFYGSEEGKDDQLLYNQYVLGGVDKLYEKLMAGVTDSDDYFVRLYEFLEEVNDRWMTVQEDVDYTNLDDLM